MPGFHEVQFPPDISYGASGGPGWSTTHRHHRLRPGAAQRQLEPGPRPLERRAWAQAPRAGGGADRLLPRPQGPRLRLPLQGLDRLPGPGRDARHRRRDDQDLPAGKGLQPAAARSTPAPSPSPSPARVKVYRDGIQATSGWSVDTTTGLVTFTTAPATGAIVTADFDFDVPARFDTDQMELTIETYELGSWGQIPVVEIRV